MTDIVTITLRVEDAEPILRSAAYRAAKNSSFCDYITRRTYNPPANPNEEHRKYWADEFRKAKRMVEVFGVEYEMVSEQETLTVHIPMKNEKRKPIKIDGKLFAYSVSGGVPDPKNAMPCYRGQVHSEACHAAADRVVRKWRAALGLPDWQRKNDQALAALPKVRAATLKALNDGIKTI
jgi:hypothetical protein